jgi:hypothetical protein
MYKKIMTSKMKTKIIIIACFVLCVVCCDSNAKKGNAHSSEKSEESQDELVHDYVNALDGFAQIMPKFGQDTEAEWAADTVHAMAASLKGKRYSYHQSMAIISQMQNYTAYGMAYFNAITGLYENKELASYVLTMIPQCDSVYNELKKSQFENVRLLSLFNIVSTQNMQMFVTLNRLNTNRPAGEELGSTMYAIALMDSLTRISEYSDKDIIKISSVMETYTFFKMIYSLVSLFSGSEEKYYENMIPMTEFAKFVDSQSSAIFKTAKNKEPIEVMSDDEHEKWLLQATKYKVKMLRLVTKLVKEWEPTE